MFFLTGKGKACQNSAVRRSKKTTASVSTVVSQADEAYKTWPPSLQQLLYGIGFQMPRVRKNLCNLVVVMDPTTPAGAEAMQVRCGAVLHGRATCRTYVCMIGVNFLHDYFVGG